MSVLRPKNRVLYFRVSEDEFQQYNHLCESTGARSVSDLARSAMQNMIRDGSEAPHPNVSEKLTLLARAVSELNDRLHVLTMSLRNQGLTFVEPTGALRVDPGESEESL